MGPARDLRSVIAPDQALLGPPRISAVSPVQKFVSPVSPFLVEPTASFQVQAVIVVKLEAFLFQQAPLEDVAAIAGQAEGHFALGVDDTVPRDLDAWLEALKDAADKAGPPRQAGHRGDLAISRDPAPRNATDDVANSLDGFILGLGGSRQLARG